MSRPEKRQKLARDFGATDIVSERGDDGVARIREMTGGLGAHSVIEAVGTQAAMMQAIRCARPGGHVGFVGVAHGVQIPGEEVFYAEVHLHGGPAPGRRFLPTLIELVMDRKIDPGKVFDLTLPLERTAPMCTEPGDTPPWRIRWLHILDDAEIDGLADVLIDCIEGGASVSFMHLSSAMLSCEPSKRRHRLPAPRCGSAATTSPPAGTTPTVPRTRTASP